jgi:hypothetical protein
MNNSKHATPGTAHSRINGHADTNKAFHPGGDHVLVIDSDGAFYLAAETMAEAVVFGESLGDELGIYAQVTVPAGVPVSEYAHSLGY